MDSPYLATRIGVEVRAAPGLQHCTDESIGMQTDTQDRTGAGVVLDLYRFRPPGRARAVVQAQKIDKAVSMKLCRGVWPKGRRLTPLGPRLCGLRKICVAVDINQAVLSGSISIKRRVSSCDFHGALSAAQRASQEWIIVYCCSFDLTTALATTRKG